MGVVPLDIRTVVPVFLAPPSSAWIQIIIMAPEKEENEKREKKEKKKRMSIGDRIGWLAEKLFHPEEIMGQSTGTGEVKKRLRKHGIDIQELYKQHLEESGPPKEWAKFHDSGICQRIVKASAFDVGASTLILLNAIWIGVDTDINDSSPEVVPIFLVGENFFCVGFTFEIVVRFIAHKSKKVFATDGWCQFDTVLVSVMVFETWIIPFVGAGGSAMGNLTILRILRLLRLLRISRLFRLVPELGILVKGMAAAARSTLSTLGLLTGIIYVFAILITKWAKDTAIPLSEQEGDISDWGAEYRPAEVGSEFLELFGDIPRSMFTLFQMMTMEDWSHITRACMHISPFLVVFYLLFILITTFTMLNMLIGVMCEVVTVTAAAERSREMLNQAYEILVGVFNAMDVDKSGSLSGDEYDKAMKLEKVTMTLDAIGVQTVNRVQSIKDWLFESVEDELTVEDFLGKVVQCRKGTPAQVGDLLDVRHQVRKIRAAQDSKIRQVELGTKACCRELEELSRRLDDAKELFAPRSNN